MPSFKQVWKMMHFYLPPPQKVTLHISRLWNLNSLVIIKPALCGFPKKTQKGSLFDREPFSQVTSVEASALWNIYEKTELSKLLQKILSKY